MMTLTENLYIERDQHVAVLTLNRPDSLNSLDPALMRALVESVRTLSEDDSVRCVVLTGAGKGFCSGGDVRRINKAADERANQLEPAETNGAKFAPSPTPSLSQWLRRSAEASRLLHDMPKPTIAMINGACAGAGLSLAAACDLRFAATSAVFRPAFAASGMPGDYGGSWLWTRILGPAKARELYFLDERRNAAEALEFGLIHRMYLDDALRAEVLAIAHRIAGFPGVGIAHAKANLNAALEEDFVASLDRESANMMAARDYLIAERRRKEA